MPHDKNGKLIKVGNIVLIPCKVKSITMSEDYCNLTVESLYYMPPYEQPTTYTLNAKQVILQELEEKEANL